MRAVVAVPLREALCQLIEEAEPRLQVVRRHDLVPPMRHWADWSGDPAFERTADEQAAFEAMVDSADVLFGIPDVDPRQLARTVAANPRLRWVMTTAAGGGSQIKAASLPAADLERITFTTSAGAHGAPLAEFAVFAAFAGAKDLPRLLADQRARHWAPRWQMRQLSDLTVLVLGLGGIGQACVASFVSLGACVWGMSRSGRSVAGLDRVIDAADLVEAAGSADVVVSTLPGTEATDGMLDEGFFRALTDGTIFVNVGRGTVVDETALLGALEDGRVSFAALDVVAVEPLPERSPLWDHPRVLISPHTAALDEREEERIARQFAANATRLLDGKSMRAQVDTVEFY